jgi:hypothetical protein
MQMKETMELLDFSAGLLIQAGNYYKIRKRACGWLLSMIAIVYWIARARFTGFQAQMFWHMVSFMMAASGWLMWRKYQ